MKQWFNKEQGELKSQISKIAKSARLGDVTAWAIFYRSFTQGVITNPFLQHNTMAASAPEKKKERPSALRSIIAGSTAGAVEISITYPAECVYSFAALATQPSIQAMLTLLIVAKTRTQLNRRLADSAKLPWPPFGAAWYAGCTTLIIGNSLKAGIRTFPQSAISYETILLTWTRIRCFRSIQIYARRCQREYLRPTNSDRRFWRGDHRVIASRYAV